jgi:cyclohexanone monooxygenase
MTKAGIRSAATELEGEPALDAVVVGAGFAGLYMLYRLLSNGFSARLFEAGGGIGGTWFWNRYPGARCDVHSLSYSYSFSEELEQDWSWTEDYASQPEIERYANYVADRFRLREHITLGTRVTSADYDAGSAEWTVRTDPLETVRARYLILATGGYSVPAEPQIPGLNTFAGDTFFTADWPAAQPSFNSKIVGVIGTGSSGTQVITALGREPLAQLYVFQRTPNFAVPGWNRPADLAFTREFKKNYRRFRELARWSGNGALLPSASSTQELSVGPSAGLSDSDFRSRMEELWDCGGIYILAHVSDLLTDEAVNARVAEFLCERVRERVSDPETAALLCPRDDFVGTRRIIVENGYFETYNRPNVSLVDVRSDPIVEITPQGVRTKQRSFDLDALILATGFDSGSGSALRIDIKGIAGFGLRDAWSRGPRTYLGLMTAGFPNMFIIAQAGSPSIRSQMLVSIEQHVDWVSDLLAFGRDRGIVEIEAADCAQDAWTDHVASVAAGSLIARQYNQYFGANIPGKPRVYLAYLGGVGPYRRICEDVKSRGYEGIRMRTGEGDDVSARLTWSGLNSDSRVYGSII